VKFAYPPPSDGKPFRLTLGLRELAPENWLEFGPDSTEQIRQRNQLIDEKREVVYQVLDGSEDGVDFFVEKLTSNLQQFHPERISSSDSKNTSDPLLQIGRLICEDLCVLKKIDGQWILVAGLVIFPSRWDLREKIGLTLDAIHGPVPSYSDSLQPLMSESFDRLKPDRPVWRRNWSLHATPKLHEPKFLGEKAPVENFWWRTERQTLTKSADEKYVLFTIRNRVEPLGLIKEDPQAAKAFAQTLETLGPEMLAYKRIVDEREALLTFLRT